MLNARTLPKVTAVACATVTIAFVLLPEMQLDRAWEQLRLSLETSGSLIVLVAAFLVYGRILRRAYLDELLLVSALAVLGLSNLLFMTVPTMADWAPDDLTLWAAPIGRSLGALLFTLAAFVPHRKLRRSGQMLSLMAGGVVTTIALAAILVHTFSKRLPPIIAHIAPKSFQQPSLHSHPALFAFELLVALLYGLAAWGFLRRSKRFNDEFFEWLAIAAILAVASHLNYSLFPSLYSPSVLYTGDIFRFAFYVALLVGCLREIWSYWKLLSETAVAEDRRRIARDLHDGLAQELAYISRNLELLVSEANTDTVARLRQAAERARIESRRAINALAVANDQAVEVALAEAAAEIAERFRIEIDLDLVPGITLSATRAEALIRIACEAITNAARHSGAKGVKIRLERSGSVAMLRISDNGCGFDASLQDRGFGLISMRERAHAVGGDLRIRSAHGRGSEVEVAI